jgi:hypothetical protein
MKNLTKKDRDIIKGSLIDTRSEQQSDMMHFRDLLEQYEPGTTLHSYAEASYQAAVDRIIDLDKIIVQMEIKEQFPDMQPAPQKPKAYLCGRVTGLPYHEVVNNFEYLEKSATWAGCEVLNPLKIVNDENAKWQEAMRKCIEVLPSCDIIYAGSNWKDSKGAKLEIVLAYFMQLPAVFDIANHLSEAQELCSRVEAVISYFGKEYPENKKWAAETGNPAHESV